eukprot:c13969_g1_i2 orf=239-550(+)
MDNLPGNSSSCQLNTNQETRPSTDDANTTAFVNHALILWQETRKEWVGSRTMPRSQQPRQPVLSSTAMYGDLLTNNRPFPRPIPLAEMADILVDIWEQEGLYE